MKYIHKPPATGLKNIGIFFVWLLWAAASRADNSMTPTALSGLVAAYSFDEGMGTTVADASGNGNNGTINGATWTSAGRSGNGLVFDGTNALVTINDSASLHLTTGMTLEAWVYPTATIGFWVDVVYKGNDNYYLMAGSNPFGFPVMGGIFGGNNVATRWTAKLATKAWTHLAGTYDGATVRLYVNGVQVSSLAQTGNILTSTNPLQIGGDSIFGQYFQGTIDEVRVYNVALTAAQIQSDMNTPIGTAPQDTPPPDDLTAPTVPTGVIASADSTTQITLQWSASTDTDGSGVWGYRIYRDGVKCGVTSKTSFSNGMLTPGAQYCYTVTAFDREGNESLASGQACATTPTSPGTAPAAPSNLAAIVVTATDITLSWQDNSNDELGFWIERAPSANGPWDLVGTAGVDATSYTDIGLTPSTTYHYRVSAVN